MYCFMASWLCLYIFEALSHSSHLLGSFLCIVLLSVVVEVKTILLHRELPLKDAHSSSSKYQFGQVSSVHLLLAG